MGGKLKNKKMVTFSIDRELEKKVSEFCKKNAINKSALVEKMLLEYLQKNKAI